MNATHYAAGVLALIAILAGANTFLGTPETSPLAGTEMVVYKSPDCGCCGVYADYARRQGMDVTVKDVADMSTVKSDHEIPSDVLSCHTTVIGDYVVEGHVPMDAIERMLDEQPDIRGIALPGMPSGSPGMPGPKHTEWEIRSLDPDGSTSTFMTM